LPKASRNSLALYQFEQDIYQPKPVILTALSTSWLQWDVAISYLEMHLNTYLTSYDLKVHNARQI